MFRPKTENEIKILHQALLNKKSVDCTSIGVFIEQCIENMADTLDNIAGSGLLYNGELATTIIGFSLRILSTALKLYLLYIESQLYFDANIIYTLIEVITITVLTASSFGVSIFAAAIIGIILANYFVIKSVTSLALNIYNRLEAAHFEQWLHAVVYQKNINLLDDQSNQKFIEQLFIRDILLQRSLHRQHSVEKHQQFQAIHYITRHLIPSENIIKLQDLYQELSADYMELQQLIHNPIDINLDQIDELSQKIINKNQHINGFLAHYNRWNLNQEAQLNEAAIKTVELSISVCMALTGLALATISLLFTLSITPIIPLALYIAPLVLGITLVVLTVAWLFTDYYFIRIEERQAMLDVLENANEHKNCTVIIGVSQDPLIESNFF